ncbi:MAG: prepilin-type N-terminal cleavage/methylation domain-containing protein [Minisyncoccia bacterium]
MLRKLSKSKLGFTLVESLVAITIFLVVVTMVGSIYISFVRQERRLYEFLKTENNIRFALEYIGRDIRMAHDFNFENNFSVFDTDSGTETLTFNDYTSKNGESHPVTYTFLNKNIQVTRYNSVSAIDLLEENVEVNSFKFYITEGRQLVPPNKQPTVIIVLEAVDQYGNEYNLETAVTPRNLNFSP